MKIVSLLLLIGLAVAYLFAAPRPQESDAGGLRLLRASEVQPAPVLTLPNAATGVPISLDAEAARHPVVLNFWATWCSPCRDELPHVQQLSQKYAGRVAFFGVNSDDPPVRVTAFARQNGLTFSMLSDIRKEAATKYGVEAIPRLLVIDTHGKVRADTVGEDPAIDTDLPKVLDALLAGK